MQHLNNPVFNDRANDDSQPIELAAPGALLAITADTLSVMTDQRLQVIRLKDLLEILDGLADCDQREPIHLAPAGVVQIPIAGQVVPDEALGNRVLFYDTGPASRFRPTQRDDHNSRTPGGDPAAAPAFACGASVSDAF
jgi:hypothetical protein